jgi:hypothetical protein
MKKKRNEYMHPVTRALLDSLPVRLADRPICVRTYVRIEWINPAHCGWHCAYLDRHRESEIPRPVDGYCSLYQKALKREFQAPELRRCHKCRANVLVDPAVVPVRKEKT